MTESPVTEPQADFLAIFAARANEQLIASHLRAACPLGRALLAAPHGPTTAAGVESMLQVELGDVVHCEALDGAGWGFGSVLAPSRLAGQRGCFRCDEVRPLLAEVRHFPSGSFGVEISASSWAALEKPDATSAQQRLRYKAALGRMRAARTSWIAAAPGRG